MLKCEGSFNLFLTNIAILYSLKNISQKQVKNNRTESAAVVTTKYEKDGLIASWSKYTCLTGTFINEYSNPAVHSLSYFYSVVEKHFFKVNNRESRTTYKVTVLVILERSLVCSDFCSETKGSRFDSGR